MVIALFAFTGFEILKNLFIIFRFDVFSDIGVLLCSEDNTGDDIKCILGTDHFRRVIKGFQKSVHRGSSKFKWWSQFSQRS